MTACLLEDDFSYPVFVAKQFIHQRSDAVHIFIADLDKDRTAVAAIRAVGEKVAGDGQPVAQIGQVGVDAVAPSVAEGLDLLGSRVMWSLLPSLTSRLVVDHWKFELKRMP